MKGKRNPVAQHMNEFNKPKTFRDRTKDYARKLKLKDEELHHPVRAPYVRDNKNYLVEMDEEMLPWDIEGEDEQS